MSKIVNVAGHDEGPLAPCGQNDRRIDYVGVAGASAERARGLREDLIESGHDGCRPLYERAEWRLSRRSSPDLAEHTCGNDEPRSCFQSFADERAHSRVGTLEGDERAGV